jgi:hypothetical protein
MIGSAFPATKVHCVRRHLDLLLLNELFGRESDALPIGIVRLRARRFGTLSRLFRQLGLLFGNLASVPLMENAASVPAPA